MGFRKVSNSRSELLSHLYNAFTFCLVKAKFHYAIQVADLVADLAFDKFMRVCDQLATFLSQKHLLSTQKSRELVATPTNLSETWSETGSATRSATWIA